MKKQVLKKLFEEICKREYQEAPEDDDWFDEQSTYGCEDSGFIPF